MNYVQCRDWNEVREVMAMSRRDGYKFSVDHQTLILTYWRAPQPMTW